MTVTSPGPNLITVVPDDEPATGLAAVDDVLPTVEFHGLRFAVRPTISLLPLMKFATIAKRHQAQTDRGDTAGAGQREMEALAALYELIEQCITEADFGAFYDHALAVGADQTELMGLVPQAMAAAQEAQQSEARPTRPSGSSPGGRSTTGASSAAGSSSPASSVPQGSEQVQRRLEEQGRPDKALVVMRAREASRSTSTG